ncbi:MAG: hypothetical protein ACRDZ8_01640 [Acidimicrobiales bacterium]
MATLTIPHVLLTVRGSVIPPTPDELRQLHNQTAGSDEGVAAARALGDLSHKAYQPVPGVPGADEKELLFIDVWRDAQGIGTFFSDAQVQQGAGMLFSDRDASLWMPARGAFGFELEAPMHLSGRYVGIVRGPVSDPEVTVDAFAKVMAANLADARRRGQLSHQLYIGLTQPGEEAEALGIDVWADPVGMAEHYAQLTGFEKAFCGAPATSVWQAATGGQWTEW